MEIAQKLSAYGRLMRVDRPIGTLLLLWPTLWALLIAAQGVPEWHLLVVFGLGVFLMRSAGCVINDFADRNFDGYVTRTQQRPLVTGEASAKEALGLFLVLSFFAFLLVLTLNTFTIVLSVGGLVLAACYPFTKRFTNLPQVVLGAAFSWAIPMAFAAVLGEVPRYAWWLFAANLSWTVAYDTLYAMVDRDDDEKVGIKSTARLFGRYDLLAVGVLQSMTLLLLALLFTELDLGWAAWLSLLIAALLFISQQVQVKARERNACFQAFLANNRVGWVLSLGLLTSYLM
ncbi:4-hydroxybenzoate octaprenyltransferase [Corallincola luteus]|uniref:4-hydroxybenzoate octaprenyltransferase n=1 Tax=Corallincola luteus TaxID=1775177 RepID=A0ABY2AFZ6_9GAMM|nr:4-hydroxybenzoate octaprenyltransferase [Corallincola luteus]TCI01399.1 4-hydroxybenzoate octaprenyltransferase [Corallincola luteus]